MSNEVAFNKKSQLPCRRGIRHDGASYESSRHMHQADRVNAFTAKHNQSVNGEKLIIIMYLTRL
jgi:hypothetical protein